jgi:hypothetical protein
MENTLPQNPQPQLTPHTQVVSSTVSNTLKMAVMGLLILLPVVAVGGYYLGTTSAKNQVEKSVLVTSPSPGSESVACTMDAKVCPDGSSVGRVGPNCEFPQCPGDEQSTEESLSGWKEVAVAECSGLRVKVPPTDFSLDSPSEMDKNRVWRMNVHSLSEGSRPFTHAVVVTYENKDGLGSGYAPGSVTVECAKNVNDLMTADLITQIRQQWESFDDGSGTFKLFERGEVPVADGDPATRYELQGGMAREGNYYYVIGTRNMIYRLNYVSMSENEKLKSTTELIFNSIRL